MIFCVRNKALGLCFGQGWPRPKMGQVGYTTSNFCFALSVHQLENKLGSRGRLGPGTRLCVPPMNQVVLACFLFLLQQTSAARPGTQTTGRRFTCRLHTLSWWRFFRGTPVCTTPGTTSSTYGLKNPTPPTTPVRWSFGRRKTWTGSFSAIRSMPMTSWRLRENLWRHLGISWQEMAPHQRTSSLMWQTGFRWEMLETRWAPTLQVHVFFCPFSRIDLIPRAHSTWKDEKDSLFWNQFFWESNGEGVLWIGNQNRMFYRRNWVQLVVFVVVCGQIRCKAALLYPECSNEIYI